MNTDKIHIQHLAAICKAKGVKYAIISPGSRCAPLIIAFNRMEGINCLSVVDERSAAFIALGIAQQTKTVVALICTSGSSILNYAPALAEAYYQKVPLLVLSADRPNEWIDQGENQSINQVEVYRNYIKKSYQLPLQVNSEKDLWFSDRIVSEAINTCIYPDFGPVHINIPLREPLYNLTDKNIALPKLIDFEQPAYSLSQSAFKMLGEKWQKTSKILIIIGGNKSKSETLDSLLQNISNQENVVILKESISNVYGENFIEQIDANVEIIQANNLEHFAPNLVITLGAGVVSKKVKFWLRNLENLEHWHITKSFEHWDIFQCLSKVIQIDAEDFFKNINEYQFQQDTTFKKDWLSLNLKTQAVLKTYLSQLNFNDFTLFEYLIKNIPANSLLQLGNSTPVRYANLLQIASEKNLKINSNRGVSGIDGVLSTAVGASIAKADQLCFCISGDIASLYDSNALFNHHLTANFKLIVINNGGGNIFKIIPGPNQLTELEQFFETQHQIQFEQLANTYNCAYYKATTLTELETNFENFVQENKQAALLEIITDGNESADALRNFFSFLKENIQLD